MGVSMLSIGSFLGKRGTGGSALFNRKEDLVGAGASSAGLVVAGPAVGFSHGRAGSSCAGLFATGVSITGEDDSWSFHQFGWGLKVWSP